MALKYKIGDRVRIKSLDWYNENKNSVDNCDVVFADGWLFSKHMSNFCGKELIIEKISHATNPPHYIMKDTMFAWTDEMIEGLVEEEVDLIPKFGEYSDNEPLDIPTMTTEFVKEHGLPCPEGYHFKDENGNVINARKIVLEKKKKEYPKTYEECLVITSYDKEERILYLLEKFKQLLICRDAYWKVAGEEMGLGKPWKPNWDAKDNHFYTIHTFNGKIECSATAHRNAVLIFPTAEMRDAFYENFKVEIEICKEVL